MIFVRRADSDSWENFTIGGTLGSYGPFNTNKTPLALGLIASNLYKLMQNHGHLSSLARCAHTELCSAFGTPLTICTSVYRKFNRPYLKIIQVCALLLHPKWLSYYRDVGPQQTRDICPMLCQCWSIVYDAGPALIQHRIHISCFFAEVCPSKHGIDQMLF